MPPEQDPISRRCTKCDLWKPLAEFRYRDRAKGRLLTRCRECLLLYARQHYSRNRVAYLAKAKRRNKLDREKCRAFVFDFLSAHPCFDCGEADIVVLDFDHRDPAAKTATVSHLVSGGLWARLAREIAKCDVRCANCHRRRTGEQLRYLRQDNAAR